MVKKYLLFIILVLVFNLKGTTQDLHFANYRFSSLLFNPAETGKFLGSMRYGVNARTQYSTFLSDPYQSVVFYADAPLNFQLTANDWAGAGFQFFHDQAGDLGFSNTGAILSGSYFIAMDPKRKNILGLGLSYMMFFRSFARPENAIFPDETGTDRERLLDFRGSGNDINLGINYSRKMNTSDYLNVGLALLYLRKQIFDGIGPQNRAGNRYNINANYGKMLANAQTLLELAFYYSNFVGFNNISTQIMANHLLSSQKKHDSMVSAGIGYRWGDALKFFVGGRHKQWHVSVAWEMPISPVRSFSNNDGAFEIGIYKIINIYKKPKVNPVILCPRL